MLDFILESAEQYSNMVSFHIAYTKVCVKSYILAIDITPVYEHFVHNALYTLTMVFPNTDVAGILYNIYSSFIVFPINSFLNGITYALDSYFSCFDTDFCIKLNNDITAFICKVADKPYAADKSIAYLLQQASISNTPSFTINPTLVEVFDIISIFGGTTFILFFYLYIIFFILVVITAILNVTCVFLTGYDLVSCNRNDNAIFLFESEKELGSIDDFIIIILSLVMIYLTYVGFFFFYNMGLEYSLTAISLMGFPLLITAAMSLPASLLFDCGVGFVTYLRGSGNSTIFCLEFMYDSLATSIMFIRLSIQNVRFLLIFFAYFEAFEFINDLFMLNEESWQYFQNLYSAVETYNQQGKPLFFLFLEVPSIILHGIYILAHLFYTFASNFVCYIVLLFWFFSFLYTMFYTDTFENHYQRKRIQEIKRFVNYYIR